MSIVSWPSINWTRDRAWSPCPGVPRGLLEVSLPSQALLVAQQRETPSSQSLQIGILLLLCPPFAGWRKAARRNPQISASLPIARSSGYSAGFQVFLSKSPSTASVEAPLSRKPSVNLLSASRARQHLVSHAREELSRARERLYISRARVRMCLFCHVRVTICNILPIFHVRVTFCGICISSIYHAGVINGKYILHLLSRACDKVLKFANKHHIFHACVTIPWYAS